MSGADLITRASVMDAACFAVAKVLEAGQGSVAGALIDAINGVAAAGSTGLSAPELYEALQNAIEALAMCTPSTPHGAACHSAAMLAGRAVLAKSRGEA